MFVTVKMVLRELLLPPGGLLLLAAAGAWLLTRRRWGWVLLLAPLAALWLLATPVVAEGLERLAQRYPALDLSHPTQAQAIVILSGGKPRWAPEYAGPAAGGVLLERVSYGAYVARRTGLPVLITGTAADVAAMEAVLERDFAIRARWTDGQSRDTFDNAELSSRLLKADGIRRIVLVTSSDHEWRATREFVSAGMAVEPAPVHVWMPHHHVLLDYLPDADGMLESSDALHELIGDAMRGPLEALGLRRHRD
ncbi:MAG TPA: YdcF family protein [Steroidobacteraceae bacterium]|nr:YdcF family protein [Steroidobacteraceae bacterium]